MFFIPHLRLIWSGSLGNVYCLKNLFFFSTNSSNFQTFFANFLGYGKNITRLLADHMNLQYKLFRNPGKNIGLSSRLNIS